jgi:hypothetical protein
MPRAWVHPHTMAGIRLAVGSVLIVIVAAVIFGLVAMSGGAQ